MMRDFQKSRHEGSLDFKNLQNSLSCVVFKKIRLTTLHFSPILLSNCSKFSLHFPSIKVSCSFGAKIQIGNSNLAFIFKLQTFGAKIQSNLLHSNLNFYFWRENSNLAFTFKQQTETSTFGAKIQI